MDCSEVKFSGHAVQRMFERDIPKVAIMAIINNGEIIQHYPSGVSVLILGFAGNRPLHVVVARLPEGGTCLVVTTYVPDPKIWSDDYRSRRTQ